jgi:hypothetical protein
MRNRSGSFFSQSAHWITRFMEESYQAATQRQVPDCTTGGEQREGGMVSVLFPEFFEYGNDELAGDLQSAGEGGAEAGMEGAGDGVVGPELGVGHAGGVEDDGTGACRVPFV